MSQPQSKLFIPFAIFSIYVIWGSTYLLNKIAVGELPPFMLASVRFLSAGLLIFLIAKALKIPLKINRKQLLNTTIAGFLFLTFGNGVIVWALRYVDSGFAALEISAQPLVILLLMRIHQKKSIKLMSMIGVALGIVGIYLLISQKQVIDQENSLLGAFMIFLCMLSWAYGSLFVAKADLPSNFFINTGYQMFIGGLLLCLVSITFGESWAFPNVWSTDVKTSMLLLIVFGSIVAFTSFNYLLKIVSPEKVATSTYVNPIVALILGWFILNENITLQSCIAAMVLLTGVYFINTKKTLTILKRFKK